MLAFLPQWSYAVAAGVLWSVSALVVNAGLKRLPQGDNLANVLAAILTSLSTGCIAVGAALLLQKERPVLDRWLVNIGGCLSFPLGTALYYLSAHAFGGKTEYAAQFTKVKPAISALLGIWFLNETLGAAGGYSLALVCAGIAVLLAHAARGGIAYSALFLGLLTAACWAGGEVMIKLAGSGSSLAIACGALWIGTAIFAVFALPIVIARKVRFTPAWYYFALHGLLSFGGAYPCNFHSVRTISVSATAMITAFWPALALFLTTMVDGLSGRPIKLSKPILLAATLLLLGSLVRLWGEWR